MQIAQKDYDSLQRIVIRVLESCQTTPELDWSCLKKRISLCLPSGDRKYPSFWIRDAAMMAESGLIPAEQLEGWLDFIVIAGQNGSAPMRLQNGLQVAPWSIADHINLDGNPVFFPGTYSSGRDQGDGRYGLDPPLDNPYYFVRLAYIYYTLQKGTVFLERKYDDVSLMERLEKAFAVSQVDPDLQLCQNPPGRHTVDWGFCDQVQKSGVLLFPSLLRYQAALNLAALLQAVNDPQKAETYLAIAKRIQQSVIDKLYDGSGWLLSASGAGKQRDVWGTAFAVWLEILDDVHLQESIRVLAEAFLTGTAVDSGYVRSILKGEDKTDNTAWESTFCPYQTYQNGAYWATPTGWYIYALSKYDNGLAEQMTNQFIAHTRANETNGAPFEWRASNDEKFDGKWYGASAAWPYAAIKRICQLR